MEWSVGYTSRYYLSIVDWDTMNDINRIEITNGTIKRSLTDLRESADVDCEAQLDNSKEHIIRIWLDTTQEGSSSHIPLFTGIAACPKDKYNGRNKKNSLECYSMLKIASDVMLPRGWYAPVEIDSGIMLKELLSCIKVPINIADNTPKLSQAIIAEQGETKLSMANKILDSMGKWRLRLDGFGSIYIEPLPQDPMVTFDAVNNDVIETSIEISYDWYNTPNILRCTMDDVYAVARDDDGASPMSIQNRGREVWMEDNDVQLSMNESLSEYAIRMLKYYQQSSMELSYTRRFHPSVYPSDIVRIIYPEQGINGTFLVSDQSIELGYNARTSEEVIRV